ncbi:MAG: hypothetical protein M1821_001011 [Bathelium mastoideum]|nr:MAG: hypothetical protein M1821_001011 [Bathelium mastoideum]
MPTFVAGFFLPYTVDFHDEPDEAQQPPPPPRPALPIRLSSHKSFHELPQPSLFSGPTPPGTPDPNADHEEFFAQWRPTAVKHFLKHTDARTLIRTDSHIDEWSGSAGIFNQPRPRADPAPPNDILEYAKAQERLKQQRERKSSPRNRSSRASSGERLVGDNWTVEPAVQGNGGLTNAVRAAQAAQTVEDVLWVGTLGFPTDTLLDGKKDEISEKLENEYDALTVYASDTDLDGHYAHYCKTILWPVFHYQIPDHPKSKAYEDHSWVYYVNVNQAFADKICSSYKRGDTIWIHDYHLLLVPGMIRKKLPDAQIGFFLHSAFPSSEVFRCLSTRKQLLEGMLGANLIAFQTFEYAHHFLQTCSRLLIVEATADGVQLEDHFVNVTSLAMGIDPQALAAAREEQDVRDWIKVIRERYAGKRLIVARDKLDNVRGVRQKLLAFELFLNKHPEWRDQVVLLQVATSTNEKQNELVATVSDIVTRIDSVHSTLAHQPLVFLKQDIGFSQYLALLSVADVLMITSLREGMNLTAHEYVFCQDGKDAESKKHGPLILSEFTGSAAVFGSNQLSVNPWDYQKCAEAIRLALEMKEDERARRHERLHHAVMTQTGEYWMSALAKQLAKVHEEHYQRDTMTIPRLSVTQLVQKYKAATKGRLFILDYEGTLAIHGSVSSQIITSPQRVIDALNELLEDSKNIVYIMSSRTPEELEHLFQQCPGLGIIAENGCFIREHTVPSAGPGSATVEADATPWLEFADLEAMQRWKEPVRQILQYYQERVEGSRIQERHCSLIFHYGDATDREAASRQAGDCANHINDACESQRVHAVPTGDRAVVIEPLDWSKGTAAAEVYMKLRHQAMQAQQTEARVQGHHSRHGSAKSLKESGMNGSAQAGAGGTDKTGGGASEAKPPNGGVQLASQTPAPIDFLMVAGDDREDEIVFRWANKLADGQGLAGKVRDVTSVSVGKRNTEAMATLTQGTTGLVTALQRLARSR